MYFQYNHLIKKCYSFFYGISIDDHINTMLVLRSPLSPKIRTQILSMFRLLIILAPEPDDEDGTNEKGVYFTGSEYVEGLISLTIPTSKSDKGCAITISKRDERRISRAPSKNRSNVLLSIYILFPPIVIISNVQLLRY